MRPCSLPAHVQTMEARLDNNRWLSIFTNQDSVSLPLLITPLNEGAFFFLNSKPSIQHLRDSLLLIYYSSYDDMKMN